MDQNPVHQPLAEEEPAPLAPNVRAEMFDAEKVSWTPASPNYLKVKLLSSLLGWVLFLGLASIPLILKMVFDYNIWAWLAYGLPALVLVWAIFDTSLVARRVRALGYAELEDHLLVKQGVLIRQVRAVPYGRMQYLEVSAGPIDRAFGLAKLELHTAASNMPVYVVGISEAEAKHLRKVLTERGVEKMVAL